MSAIQLRGDGRFWECEVWCVAQKALGSREFGNVRKRAPIEWPEMAPSCLR